MASKSLTAMTAAALVLPGLSIDITNAADDDSVDFQYSHYQEGKRDIYGLVTPKFPPTTYQTKNLPQNLNPIEVESVHGSGRFTLSDRIKFAFNYSQDTWSGATPIGTAPVAAYGNSWRYKLNPDTQDVTAITGASPLADPSQSNITFFFDRNNNFYQPEKDRLFNQVRGGKNNKLTHVLAYASPETRKQGDFKLTYEWDEAAFEMGGGISVENDYESRFGSLGGRFDFNQKQTTVNWGVSYTNSDTRAELDPDGLSFFSTDRYDTANGSVEFDENGIGRVVVEPKSPEVAAGQVENTWSWDQNTNRFSKTRATLFGSRQDWGSSLGLTQIVNKNSLLTFNSSYTRSTGYLGNPYKLVYALIGQINPNENIGTIGAGKSVLEIRPDERNLFNWRIGYSRFVEPLNAALHVGYNFAHDDWDINAHTFEADWVQPFGEGWTVTPRIRYYSQSNAGFYTHYIEQITENGVYDPDTGAEIKPPRTLKEFPDHYSSDQRLSGFGTLSGGLTVDKQFARGLGLQLGFEYYTHQGGLKLGGGGEQDFADFDYWMANAALKVKLAALEQGGSHGWHGMARGHYHHSNAPAGVQFDHVLPKAGDFMADYRYVRNVQAGNFRLTDQKISLGQARKEGCYGVECAVTPNNMTMNMHMLDLMVAPTDWLTIMLMPQWADMDMHMSPNPDVQLTGGHGGHSAVHEHQTGGIGDLAMYSLFKLYGDSHHQVNLALGATAPTGDVDIMQRKTGVNPIDNNPIHYCMQLGSGTWDFKPALTYTGQVDKLSWGAQVNGTLRLESRNKSGFAFGDIFQGTAWGGYQWTDWLVTTVRGVYTAQGEIKGRYPAIMVDGLDENGNPIQVPYVDRHIDTFGQPQNYGGSFADLGLGVNVTVPQGAFAGNSLKFEWLQPVYTNFNGYQPDRDYALNVTWSYGF